MPTNRSRRWPTTALPVLNSPVLCIKPRRSSFFLLPVRPFSVALKTTEPNRTKTFSRPRAPRSSLLRSLQQQPAKSDLQGAGATHVPPRHPPPGPPARSQAPPPTLAVLFPFPGRQQQRPLVVLVAHEGVLRPVLRG